MSRVIVIKSNRYGITLFLDKDASFQELLGSIREKFRASSKFFKDAQMALAFEGRQLTQEEQIEVIQAIQESSGLQVLCILENDALKESEHSKQIVEGRKQKSAESDGTILMKERFVPDRFWTSETSIVILGDVNPGATVVSKGNVVVLGALKGTIHAGAAGNESCFVAALNMMPMQIRIGDCIARSADGPMTKGATEPMIAYTENGNIYMEPITKEVINDIRI